MKQLEYLMSQTGILTKAKKKFIGDKAFYRYLIFLAFPMIVQNGITSFVSFLDNIMVGQIGTEPMSGVAIVNQLFFVFNICIFGGVSGAGIFSAQFFGKGDFEGQKYTFISNCTPVCRSLRLPVCCFISWMNRSFPST